MKPPIEYILKEIVRLCVRFFFENLQHGNKIKLGTLRFIDLFLNLPKQSLTHVRPYVNKFVYQELTF